MAEEKESSTNLLIFLSIVFLFIIFVVVQPTRTGYFSLPLVGDTSTLSNPTLIGAVVILLFIWAGVFLLYVKIKKKKQLQNLPDLPNSDLIIPEQTQTSQLKQGLSEDELKKLFNDISPIMKEEVKENKPEKVQEKVIPQKKESNINDLRNLMTNLLSKNYSKESILKYLQKKGYSLNEISVVTNDVNKIRLREYVQKAKSLGYKKDKIIAQLKNKGWSLEDIKQIT